MSEQKPEPAKQKQAPVRETVQGRITQILYRKDLFVIATLSTGAIIIGEDAADCMIQQGVIYEFHGTWTTHAKHGRRFKFGAWSPVVEGRAGIISYLTHFVPNIGKRRAERLFDTYGLEAVATLRDRYQEVVDAKILGQQSAHAASLWLRENHDRQALRVQLYALLGARHFPMTALTDAVLAKWGNAAPEVIRRDPWCLLVNQMPGCSWGRIDQLFLDLGGDPLHWKRQTICVWHVIRTDRNGHTWLDVNAVGAEVANMISGASPKVAMRRAKKAGWVVSRRPGPGQRPYLTIREYSEAEDSIAQSLRRLMQCPYLPTSKEALAESKKQ